jgi:hypothetical protein
VKPYPRVISEIQVLGAEVGHLLDASACVVEEEEQRAVTSRTSPFRGQKGNGSLSPSGMPQHCACLGGE